VSKPAFSTNQIHALACKPRRAHDGQRKRVAHMRTQQQQQQKLPLIKID
jgi:hypothetical protein